MKPLLAVLFIAYLSSPLLAGEAWHQRELKAHLPEELSRSKHGTETRRDIRVKSASTPRFTDAQAVRAIVGEAANQGHQGMLAVACAIRNRGNLKGVFGLTSKMPDTQPAWVWARAHRAWLESANCDVTAGASYWENTKAFGTPKWAAGMVATVTIGDQTFFRP